MYTLNDAKLDCLREFKSLGLETPNPLWLDFVIKLIVKDFYKQKFVCDGLLGNLGLEIDNEGNIPINENFARDIIINAVLGIYYANVDVDEMNDYAYTLMEVTKEYNDFLMEEQR